MKSAASLRALSSTRIPSPGCSAATLSLWERVPVTRCSFGAGFERVIRSRFTSGENPPAERFGVAKSALFREKIGVA
jgi:hypothetical protein